MNDFYTVRGYELKNRENKVLSPSLEDYLEMIYREIGEKGYVRINELAKNLNVKPPSASKMAAKLSEKGFISYEKYGIIKGTERGKEQGAYLLWRHKVVSDFFSLLSDDKDDKLKFIEVEQVEHVLNPKSVYEIEMLVNYFQDGENLSEYLNWKGKTNIKSAETEHKT
ncbi:MAG: MarR family transcriptional regulator [Eubacteriales bacterium]